MDRSSRDPRSTSPRSVSRARSLSRLAAACLRVITTDDTLRPKPRQDIFENYVPDNRKACCAKGKAQNCIFLLADRTGRFCSTKHAARSTPHENKKLRSGLLRRKVAKRDECAGASPPPMALHPPLSDGIMVDGAGSTGPRSSEFLRNDSTLLFCATRRALVRMSRSVDA